MGGAAALPDIERMHAFLYGLLGRGFVVDGTGMAACHRILIEALAEGQDEIVATRLKFRLAPVVARTPLEQADFYRLYDIEFASPQEVPCASAPCPATSFGLKPRRVALCGAVVAVIGALVATGMFLTQASWKPNDVEVALALPPSVLNVDNTSVEGGSVSEAGAIQVMAYSFYDVAYYFVAMFPLVVFVVWAAVRWRRRVIWLRRERNHSKLPPTLFPLPLLPADVLYVGPEVRDHARKLRQQKFQVSRKLDAKQTVDATVRRAGLVAPVYARRPCQQEYVFLIEQVSIEDHLARLFDLALDRLRNEHVRIERYYFRTDPRNLRADDPGRSPVKLSDIAGRVGDFDHLFIVGTADGLFHPLTGDIEAGVMAMMEPWRSRTILSCRPMNLWGEAELRLLEEGFSLATPATCGLSRSSAS